MRRLASRRRIVALATLCIGCGRPDAGDSDVVRGRGYQPVALPATAEARVYEEAIRAAFDLGPSLILLLHPRRLPRTAGTADGAPVPDEVLNVLRQRGVVQGACIPVRDGPRNTPRCALPAAGYVVRGSDLLHVGADTVELYLSAERFGPATGQRPEALRFEKIYQLVGGGTTWRVAREARVSERSP